MDGPLGAQKHSKRITKLRKAVFMVIHNVILPLTTISHLNLELPFAFFYKLNSMPSQSSP